MPSLSTCLETIGTMRPATLLLQHPIIITEVEQPSTWKIPVQKTETGNSWWIAPTVPMIFIIIYIVSLCHSLPMLGGDMLCTEKQRTIVNI